MKKHLIILVGILCLSLGLTSCGTTYAFSTGQSEMYDYEYDNYRSADINVIISYGTPYYYNGYLSYYLYNGLYYYPFWYDNMWYFRPYRVPFRYGYIPRFRPSYGDMCFRPGRYGFSRPSNSFSGRPRFGQGGYRRGYEINPNMRYNNQRPYMNRSTPNYGRRNVPNVNHNGSVRFGGRRPSSTMSTPHSSSPSRSFSPRGSFGRGQGSSFSNRPSGTFNGSHSSGTFGGSRRFGGKR